ncbi:MAG: YbjN domain-containing protein [Oscillospiraceae bacterium]|nr:YbjN domain-containing protein [Oscillospiraceae bacterium]
MKHDIDYIGAVRSELDSLELEYTEKRRDDGDNIFRLYMPMKNGPQLLIKLVVDESTGDSRLRSYLLTDVAEAARPALVQKLNELNNEYRFICLSLDGDGDLLAAYDFALFGTPQDIGQHAVTAFLLFYDLCDKVFPAIMKTVLAERGSVGEEEAEDWDEEETDEELKNLFAPSGNPEPLP